MKKEKNIIDTLHTIAIWLVKNTCIDTNATEFKYTLEGMYHKDKQLGNWELIVRKQKK